MQNLAGNKPSGDDAAEDEKLAFDDLPPPPDVPPLPPSFSPDQVKNLDGDEPPSPERELVEDAAPESPAFETVQDLGGNEPTAPDDILLG